MYVYVHNCNNRYGTSAQKAEWLVPLLEGKIRSAFAMTGKTQSVSQSVSQSVFVC